MEEITLIKNSNGLFELASAVDTEIAARFKIGEAVRFKPTKIKQRSLKFHQMYFSGLLALTLQYWEPDGGLVSKPEESIIWKFSRYLGSAHDNPNVLDEITHEYISQLESSRSGKVEAPHKTVEMLHEWVVEKAGYYDFIITPEGLKKKRKSINFNAMDNDKFNNFYKAAFNVCWKYVLSRSFKTEKEAQNVVDQLQSLT